jgi:uncharacterized RDD family membrane protein YckC
MNSDNHAGFWIRFFATLIDVVVMLVFFTIPLALIYGETYWDDETLIHGFWDVMLGYVAPFVATIWFWLRFLGTPGKMALKLRIVDASSGGRMRTGQAVGRYFAYFVSAIPLCLGFLWIGLDKRKQGWHDKLASTVVIRDTGKASVQDEPGQSGLNS